MDEQINQTNPVWLKPCCCWWHAEKYTHFEYLNIDYTLITNLMH